MDLYGNINKFKNKIKVEYPNGNSPIFEEWFAENYKGCNTDRELIPVFFTSWWVNHSYGMDVVAFNDLQDYIDSLDRSKKWFCITQYDDSVLIDFKDLDVLRFEMSKNIGIQIPLLCQPHPYKFTTTKKWLANFVGGKTHPIRDCANDLKNRNGYYISFDHHSIETYCRILHESIFTLCYRGYGINSFRISESLQYGSIPVYISTGDDFIMPYGIDFEEFGVIINGENVYRTAEILESIEPVEIVKKQEKIQEVYQKYYTYESNMKLIIEQLESEYNNRQKPAEICAIDG